MCCSKASDGFLLGRWVSDARAMAPAAVQGAGGTRHAAADFLAWNARAQVTSWVPSLGCDGQDAALSALYDYGRPKRPSLSGTDSAFRSCLDFATYSAIHTRPHTGSSSDPHGSPMCCRAGNKAWSGLVKGCKSSVAPSMTRRCCNELWMLETRRHPSCGRLCVSTLSGSN